MFLSGSCQVNLCYCSSADPWTLTRHSEMVSKFMLPSLFPLISLPLGNAPNTCKTLNGPRFGNIADYFAVPKGTNNIFMVFNSTKSGLTEALWAPSFWLPNALSMLRIISFNHCPVDIDIGEYFINLPLDPALRLYSGVGLTVFSTRIMEE